jgi:hypothetical protein
MATLKNGIGVGNSGSIGNLYIRTRRGSTEICSKPGNYHPSQLDYCVQLRDNWRILSTISKAAASEKNINQIWQSSSMKGLGAYNKLITFNHPGKRNPIDFSRFKILPGDGDFIISIANVEVAGVKYCFTVNPLGEDTGINPERELYALLRGVLVFFNPIDAKNNVKATLHTPAKIALNLENPLGFAIHARDYHLLRDYNNALFLFMMFTLNSEDQPVKHSATAVYQMK